MNFDELLKVVREEFSEIILGERIDAFLKEYEQIHHIVKMKELMTEREFLMGTLVFMASNFLDPQAYLKTLEETARHLKECEVCRERLGTL